MRRGLEGFRGLPQRLEWFAIVDGRRFYNDSTATTPELTIAALRIAGRAGLAAGRRKEQGVRFRAAGRGNRPPCTRCGIFRIGPRGTARTGRRQAPPFPCAAVETLEEALQWCWPRSRPGEAIVLSPACASTDQFRNFRQRGERFVELVGNCQSAQSQSNQEMAAQGPRSAILEHPLTGNRTVL